MCLSGEEIIDNARVLNGLIHARYIAELVRLDCIEELQDMNEDNIRKCIICEQEIDSIKSKSPVSNLFGGENYCGYCQHNMVQILRSMRDK